MAAPRPTAPRRTDIEAALASAMPGVPQPPPMPDAGVAALASSAPTAASARTAAAVETADAIARAIAAEVVATPALARGEGQVVIRLKPDVLSGSEITLSAKGGTLSVEIAPATPEAAARMQAALPGLETALAGHVSEFHSFSVSLKKGRKDETA